MNYKKAFQNLNNVKVSNYSPRESGETEARSEWKEVKLNYVDYATRVALIKELASKHQQVHLRTATLGHRARLYVRN